MGARFQDPKIFGGASKIFAFIGIGGYVYENSLLMVSVDPNIIPENSDKCL
jgi:hypothetical protein